MTGEMREWRGAFAATQLAALSGVPVAAHMMHRFHQACIALYDSEICCVGCGEAARAFERKRRIRRIGETTAARWVAGYVR